MELSLSKVKDECLNKNQDSNNKTGLSNFNKLEQSDERKYIFNIN